LEIDQCNTHIAVARLRFLQQVLLRLDWIFLQGEALDSPRVTTMGVQVAAVVVVVVAVVAVVVVVAAAVAVVASRKFHLIKEEAQDRKRPTILPTTRGSRS
jgi:hypothetical protein